MERDNKRVHTVSRELIEEQQGALHCTLGADLETTIGITQYPRN